MNLTFHYAYRRKDKSSRISAKAAIFKRGGKPCKYSYVVEGGMVDAEQTARMVNQTL